VKALVDRLTVGKIPYKTPEIKISVSSIIQSVEADSCFGDHFVIESLNDVAVRGLVYSTNSRVKIENNQFGGTMNQINYRVDTNNVVDGKKIEGTINIVSNAGEYAIPYDITVLDYTIKSSIGNVENYFHFANLVQMNYEEALKLFTSKDFKRLMAKNDPRHLALYDGLFGGIDKELAMEEFLITINKKKPVILNVNRERALFKNVQVNYSDVFVLSRSTWGYTDISVEIDGTFLKECRNKISQDDFIGNKYEYKFLIDADKLYKGINYGRIVFKCHNQILKCSIEIDNSSNDDRLLNTNIKDKIIKAANRYLDFRMKKCNLANWANESLSLMEGLIHLDESLLMPVLVKAQILISQEKTEEAGRILDDFIKNKLIDADKNIDLYCYYLYVRSLEKREVVYTTAALEEVKKVYEKENSWKNLWVMLYLDERYEINKSLKYTMIKEQFGKGCHSPFMYYEALNVINEQPRLLRILNNFELQILLFGARHDYISDGLASQLAELAVLEKKFSTALYQILTLIYKNNKDIGILTAICSVLIRGSKVDSRYFKWYESGVNEDIRLTNLYEYYMFSIDQSYVGLLPKIIYMYFIYNGEALGRRQAFLYSNIINNKRRIPNIYHNYLQIMEQYLVDQLFLGNMDRELSIIYNDILKSSIINGDIAKNLPDIILTYELVCNDPNMKEAVVIHKETTGETIHKIVDGKAYVSIYTEDPIIVFIDTYGRRFTEVSYELVQLLNMQEYLKQSFELYRDNEYLLLYFSEKYTRYQNNPLDTVDVYKNIMTYKNIRPKYKQDLIDDIVNFYYENYKGDQLNDYLVTIDKTKLHATTRDKVIEMMIEQGLYEAVYQEIKNFGYQSIDYGSLAVCCTRFIESADLAEDHLLVEICAYVFKKGKYNEEILGYLSKNFYGTIDEMIEIWKAENDFVYENHELEERILVQVMFTGNTKADLSEIFKSYYRYGIGKNIRIAFYTYCSYNIFMKKIDHVAIREGSYIFEYLEKDMMQGFGVSGISKIALVEYASMKEQVTEKQKELYKNLMYQLSDHNVIFEFYKKFTRWFEVPFYVTDRTVVDYRTMPDAKVHISYTIGNNKEESRLIVEEMTCIHPGIYVKNFTLFYGDKVNYYISEISEDENITSDSCLIRMDNPHQFNDDSRYSMINHIIIAKENGEKEAEQEAVRAYVEKRHVVENIFYIC